jgi:SNF2 family DNA or RNA helicase
MSHALALSPGGHLFVEQDDQAEPKLSHATAARLNEVFGASPARGLEALASEFLHETLPPTFVFWRGVAQRLFTALCHNPNLQDASTITIPKPSAAEWSALAEWLEAPEVEGIQRRGIILAFLTRFKQICNHPSQWLGDGVSAPAESGKFNRLRELCDEIASRQEKVLVFTQYREITDPLARHLAGVFGQAGLILHGGVPVGKRKDLVDAFQRDGGPPFFVLSLKAGGTGLNLTAASHVIHFDRWWNPAVENQATDRAFRIGQKRNVMVHKFTCRGTLEERIHEVIASKSALAEDVLGEGGERLLTEMNNSELLRFVALDINATAED